VVVTLSSLELKQRQVAWRYYDWFRPSIAGIVLSAPSTVKIFSLCSPECQAAGNVPRRTAALGHDNNPADQFVSDSSKYMRSANSIGFRSPRIAFHVIAGLVPATPHSGIILA
jgi:hypothetical protein